MGVLSFYKKIAKEILKSMPEEYSRKVVEYYVKKIFFSENTIPLPVFSLYICNSLRLNKEDKFFVATLSTLIYFMADIYDDAEDDEVPSEFSKELLIVTASLLQNKIFKNISDSNYAAEIKLKLFSTISTFLSEMVKGQIMDITLTTCPNSYPYEIPELKAGMEVSLFFLLPCLLSNDSNLCNKLKLLGFNFGKYLQILSDYLDIWYKDFSKDISQLKITLPIFIGFRSGNRELLELFSSDRDHPDNQMRIRQLLIKVGANREFKNFFYENKKQVVDIVGEEKIFKELVKQVNTLYNTGKELIEVLNELEDEL